MGRRPREDEPGSLHHVGDRGLARRSLIENEVEAQALLVRLVCQAHKGRILLRAFVLMTNHFHLLVESPLGELGRAMQEVLGGHTRFFNRNRPGRDGTLYADRYWSRPVLCVPDARGVTAYIHDHPRKANIIGAEAGHPFCSSSYLIRAEPPPLWLDLRRSGRPRGGPPTAPEKLSPEARRFVEERMRHPARGPDPLADLYLSAPAHVQQWFVERAQLADQTRPGMPVVDSRTVLRVCREAYASDRAWRCDPTGRRPRDAWPVAATGLFRELAGLTYQQIGRILGRTAGAISDRHQAHRRCVVLDPEYAARIAELAVCCMDRCHGREPVGELEARDGGGDASGRERAS